jgi:hypothetical protein
MELKRNPAYRPWEPWDRRSIWVWRVVLIAIPGVELAFEQVGERRGGRRAVDRG